MHYFTIIPVSCAANLVNVRSIQVRSTCKMSNIRVLSDPTKRDWIERDNVSVPRPGSEEGGGNGYAHNSGNNGRMHGRGKLKGESNNGRQQQSLQTMSKGARKNKVIVGTTRELNSAGGKAKSKKCCAMKTKGGKTGDSNNSAGKKEEDVYAPVGCKHNASCICGHKKYIHQWLPNGISLHISGPQNISKEELAPALAFVNNRADLIPNADNDEYGVFADAQKPRSVDDYSAGASAQVTAYYPTYEDSPDSRRAYKRSSYNIIAQRISQTNHMLTDGQWAQGEGSLVNTERAMIFEHPPALFQLVLASEGVSTGHNHQYERWEFSYEPVLHDNPAPHLDFWFATAKMMAIPPHKIARIATIADSISLYARGHCITTGCHFLSASIVTMFLAKTVLLGYFDTETARAKYPRYIMMAAKEQKEADMAYYHNLQELGSEFNAITHYTALMPFALTLEYAYFCINSKEQLMTFMRDYQNILNL